jgi:hypothetical protein
MKSKSAYEKVYVSFQDRNNKKSITEVTEVVILAFLDMGQVCRTSLKVNSHYGKNHLKKM